MAANPNFMEKDGWTRLGFVFGIATVVMLIATLIQLHGYYLKDVGGDDDTTKTLSEICSEFEEEAGNSFDYEVFTYCEPEQEKNYQMIWQLLISIGLTMLCLGKRFGEEEVSE
jgi:hypothetical protein